jgi:hypothetical protein
MTSRIARTLSAALSSATLLAQIWESLSGPITALFAADETDGRGVWDPDG